MKQKPIRDSLRFFWNFVRHPGSVGAVMPSSRFLARALVGEPELQAGDVVLEYGPGTGPMTEVIDRVLPEGVTYLGIELDEGFCKLLSARFPEREFHCGSVADVEQILVERGLARPKLIISGLPFASLPAEVQKGVVEGTHAVLREDGQFRTFQYVHAFRMNTAKRFRAAMAAKFAHFERSRSVLRNVPPAYVLAYRP